jgi:hypothetical protein
MRSRSLPAIGLTAEIGTPLARQVFREDPVATCARCHDPLTHGHVCRRRTHEPGPRRSDFFLGAVLGGAIGILLFGMFGDALFGRTRDTFGLVSGSLAGVTFVRAVSRLALR